MRRAAVAAALLLVSASCGGNQDAAGTDETVATTAATTTTEASDPSDETTTTTSGDDGGEDGELPLPPELDSFPEQSIGTVVWRVSDRQEQEGTRHVFRAVLASEFVTEDVTAALDELDPTPAESDSSITISRDGQTLMVITNRFGCDDVSCLAVLPSDLSDADVVDATQDGSPITIDGPSAVADGGELVVVPLGTGPHELDLFTIARDGDGWGEPQLITAESEEEYNDAPRFTPAGGAVLFDCGSTPYSQGDTGICEVSLDGGPVEVLVPAPAEDRSAKTGAYEADASLVFESAAEDYDEVLWRMDTATGEIVRVEPAFANDNSPCVLPSGWIASLWLRRPGNDEGYHELRLLAPGNEGYVIINPGIDVEDVSVGCGA
ncbi:MAG: hypothetical protein M3527_03205 [Actinomycetota bacterium]|nr:hypothetical protein [Acidimicrobiia bacterium]MDQ3293446.1 hypothetical protein [Actinomycetota bacterium]